MKIKTKQKQYLNLLRKFQWLIITTMIFFIFTKNMYFQNTKIIINTVILLLGSITIFNFLMTKTGKKLINLIIDAKIEIKNILWSTPIETFYTTLIVSISTILISLLLLITDKFFFHMISFITNIRL